MYKESVLLLLAVKRNGALGEGEGLFLFLYFLCLRPYLLYLAENTLWPLPFKQAFAQLKIFLLPVTHVLPKRGLFLCLGEGPALKGLSHQIFKYFLSSTILNQYFLV
jgi:hypothetical protein